MSKRYSATGHPQFEFEVGPNEMVRGATWYRGTTQIRAQFAGNVDLLISQGMEIVGIYILTGGGAGSCVIDVWKDSLANFPPTVDDTIFSSGKPTISNDVKYQDTTLTGVDTTLAAGDTLRFKLDSSSTFTHISIFLVLRPT